MSTSDNHITAQVDGKFLVLEPELLVEQNLFKKCSVLLGTNANEGMSALVEFLPELSTQANLYELSPALLDSAMTR